MSTTPDELVTLLSRRLAGGAGDAELLRALADVDAGALNGDAATAVEELRAALADGAGRGKQEMLMREALEALAFG